MKYLTQALIKEESYSVQELGPNALSISLSRVSLRQLQKLLYSIETSPAGLDLTAVDVDTKSDPKGFLWSNIGFRKGEPRAAAPEKKETNKSFSR